MASEDSVSGRPVVQQRRLFSNTLLNLAGQVLPAIAGFAAVPVLVHGLGAPRFGVLSLCLAVGTYLSIFDFGLGRASIRFLSTAFETGNNDRQASILWTSLAVQLAIGLIAALAVFFAVSPSLMTRTLHVSGPLAQEAVDAFRLLALAMPAAICLPTARGILEAGQRFGIVNIIRAPSGSLLFLAPAAVVHIFHQRLIGAMFAVVVVIVLTTTTYLVVALVQWPQLLQRVRAERTVLRALLGFGIWVTVANVLVPFLLYADRLFIPALVSVTALAYYAVPSDLANRLQVLPSALTSVIYPSLSRLNSDPRAMSELAGTATRFLIVVMAPFVLLGLAAGGPFLHFWVGGQFAVEGQRVLGLLAVGVCIDALAQVPAQLLDAAGHPRRRAVVLGWILPVYLILTVVLIARWGILGAATAWTLRSVVALLSLVIVASRSLGRPAADLVKPAMRPALVAVTFAAAATAISWLNSDSSAAWAMALLVVYFAVVWLVLLDPSERLVLRSAARYGARAAFAHSDSP